MRIYHCFKPFPTPGEFDILVGTHEEKEEHLNKEYGYGNTKHPGSSRGSGQCIDIHTTDGLVRVLWFEKLSRDPTEFGLVIHELLHFTFAELRDAGITHTSESEEIYTYYLQTIVVNLLDCMDRAEKNDKSKKKRKK